MFSLQNKRVLLVSLCIFLFLFITSQARNMPKETTTTTTITTKGVNEKVVITASGNLSPTSTTTGKAVQKSSTDIREAENMGPTSTEDLSMMDYSAAQNKNPSHNQVEFLKMFSQDVFSRCFHFLLRNWNNCQSSGLICKDSL